MQVAARGTVGEADGEQWKRKSGDVFHSLSFSLFLSLSLLSFYKAALSSLKRRTLNQVDRAMPYAGSGCSLNSGRKTKKRGRSETVMQDLFIFLSFLPPPLSLVHRRHYAHTHTHAHAHTHTHAHLHTYAVPGRSSALPFFLLSLDQPARSQSLTLTPHLSLSLSLLTRADDEPSGGGRDRPLHPAHAAAGLGRARSIPPGQQLLPAMPLWRAFLLRLFCPLAPSPGRTHVHTHTHTHTHIHT